MGKVNSQEGSWWEKVVKEEEDVSDVSNYVASSNFVTVFIVFCIVMSECLI